MQRTCGALVVLGALALVPACGSDAGDDTGSSSQAATGAHTYGVQKPGLRYVRIRPIDVNQASGPLKPWAAPDYTAAQILDLVADARPDVLERYTSGDVEPSYLVPTGSAGPMTASQFLTASEANESCNAVVTPRVSLGEYDSGTLFTTTADLLKFPVSPHAMHFLSLDNWAGFVATHSRATAEAMFQRLKVQGWAQININGCGLPNDAAQDWVNGYGDVTGVEVCVDTSTWQPNYGHLSKAKASPNVELILLYIDFPGQVQTFEALAPEHQADVLTWLASKQQELGYTLIYNVLQEVPDAVGWDATKIATSPTGPYLGKTIFQIMKDLMDRYNPRMTTCP